jgi:hypothetical protein
MKIKIRFKDPDGKETVIEKKTRNPQHLWAQQNLKHNVFRDRTKYNRKKKHKKNYEDYDS